MIFIELYDVYYEPNPLYFEEDIPLHAHFAVNFICTEGEIVIEFSYKISISNDKEEIVKELIGTKPASASIVDTYWDGYLDNGERLPLGGYKLTWEIVAAGIVKREKICSGWQMVPASGTGDGSIGELKVKCKTCPSCTTLTAKGNWNINPSSGNLYYNETDLIIPGKMPIMIGRHFNSTSLYTDRGSWRFNWDEYLRYEWDGSVTLVLPDTHSFRFIKNEDCTYSPYSSSNYYKLARDVEGNFTVTYPDQSKHYFKGVTGNLLKQVDANGNYLSYTWVRFPGRDLDEITAIIDSSGRKITFSYEYGEGTRKMTVTDWIGRSLIYNFSDPEIGINNKEYSEALASFIDIDGTLTTFTSEEVGVLPGMHAITLSNGLTISNYRLGDAPNEPRIGRQKVGELIEINYEYDKENRVTSIDVGGRVSRTYYSATGDTIQEEDPLGNIFQYEHDDRHNITKVTDPRLAITSYTWDLAGNMLTKTDALDNTWTYEYNPVFNNITKTKSPAPFNYESTSTYDENTGNLLATTDALGHTTYYEYYSDGLLKKVTDPNGNSVEYSYDSLGNKNSITDSLGKVTQFKYDRAGNLIKTVDPLGSVTTSVYNDKNRLTSTTDAMGNTSRFEYDEEDRLISTTDALNRTTRNFYDIYGRLIKTQDNLGNYMEYEYNEFNNLISLTDSNGHGAEFSYDVLNRLTETTDPLGRKTTFSYDPYCNKSSKTDPEGKTTTYHKDSLCRVTKIEYHDGSFVQYMYDELGRRTSMTNPGPVYGGFNYGEEKYGYDPDQSFTYEYDALSRMTKVNYPGGKSISYAYNNVGNLTRLTDINDESTDYEYDANSMMTKVTNDGDEVLYEYDDGGRLTKMTLPNGITCDYSYNSNGQITRMLYMNGVSTVCDIQYKYGKGGNRIQKSIEMPPNPAVVEDYSYDASYRLVQVMKDGVLFRSYTYDAMGNRLSKRTPSDTISCGYDACDQMNYAGDLSYRYDLKGRLIASYSPDDDAERIYVWDYVGKLRYINYPDGTKSEMRYDCGGKRTYRKDKNGDITNYYWSPSGIGNVINETDGTGTAKASYIHGIDLIAIKVSDSKKYYLKDALGSVVALADASGNVTDTYEYSDFGELISSTGSSYNPYLYIGQQFDSDSELYYLGARFYNHCIGRFISRDPIGRKGGLNLYTYAENNPALKIDPSGLISIIGKEYCPSLKIAHSLLKETVAVNPRCIMAYTCVACPDIVNILNSDHTPPNVFVPPVYFFKGTVAIYHGDTDGGDNISVNNKYCDAKYSAIMSAALCHEIAHWCASQRLGRPTPLYPLEPPEGYATQLQCFHYLFIDADNPDAGIVP